MTIVANVIGYQLVWLAVVWSAGAACPLIGVCASLAFVALQLGASQARRRDARLIVVALMCGVVVDGWLAKSGWVRYAAAEGPGPAPVWILALWAAFAMTLNHSLRWLLGRPWAGAALGAFGGPLAYLAASRGFGAIALEPPERSSIAAVALGWALALALLAIVGGRERGPSPQRVSP